MILSLKVNLDFNNRSKYEKTAINKVVVFFHIERCGKFSREIIKILVQNVVARRQISHTKLCRGNLARELMQFFRQISLIGLRGCFPVVHCGNNLKAQ